MEWVLDPKRIRTQIWEFMVLRIHGLGSGIPTRTGHTQMRSEELEIGFRGGALINGG